MITILVKVKVKKTNVDLIDTQTSEYYRVVVMVMVLDLNKTAKKNKAAKKKIKKIVVLTN